MLDDGFTYSKILQQLGPDAADLTPRCVMSWKDGGFQATQQIAAAQICEAVATLGPEVLHDALKANPLNYFRMLNSFSRLTNGGLKCERHIADEAERQARHAQPNPEPGGVPDEILEEFKASLKRM